MKKNLKGMFSRVHNGDFLIAGKEPEDLPKAWYKIGGDKATRWKYRQGFKEGAMVQIEHTAKIRAGIIQTLEDSLDVRQEKEWLIILFLKSDRAELKAYLRCYPMISNGDVSEPLVFYFSVGQMLGKYKQVVSLDSDIEFMRLETGIVGSGCLEIYQLVVYPIRSNVMKRRVKTAPKRPLQISYIQSIGEITKPIQLAVPIPIKVPLTVQATVDAEIRNLTPTRDKVQIFGSSLHPLATSNNGRAQVEIGGHEFHESIEEVTANQTPAWTTTRDVAALPRFSFAVYNYGSVLARVQAELSPNGIIWAKEGPQREVSPGELIIISSENFLRYTRLTYWADNPTALRVWVQAQS